MQFVGLDQFRFLWDDPVFWMSIRNTLVIWVLSTVPTLFGALVLATLLHSVRRFKGFYRIALYIPFMPGERDGLWRTVVESVHAGS
jgi:cellobiose transport system permease protein